VDSMVRYEAGIFAHAPSLSTARCGCAGIPEGDW
jgi:hypothetical protein